MDVNQLAQTVLAWLLPVLAALAVEYLRRMIGTEKMAKVQAELEAKRDLAELAVRFVEQAYVKYGGADKFNTACQWLSDRAKEKGIKISQDEIEGLIEGSLRLIKDEFGEAWAKAGTAE